MHLDPTDKYGYAIEKDNQLVRQFFSPVDYADYLENITQYYPPKDWGHDHKAQEVRDTIPGLRNGDINAANLAEKIISQLEDEQIFAEGLPQPEAAIVGGFTVTQLYNQGIPTCMLTYDNSHLKGLNTPLTIYFDIYGSIGLSHERALNRGVACLAFIMAMSRIRPIEMYVITCSSPLYDKNSLYGSLVKVPTNPLDLPVVGFMLTNHGYYSYSRWTSMSREYCKKHPHREQIYYSAVGPFGGKHSQEGIKDKYKEALNAKEDDIILYGTQTTAPRIHDENAAKDPVGWVKKMLKLHRDKD